AQNAEAICDTALQALSRPESERARDFFQRRVVAPVTIRPVSYSSSRLANKSLSSPRHATDDNRYCISATAKESFRLFDTPCTCENSRNHPKQRSTPCLRSSH